MSLLSKCAQVRSELGEYLDEGSVDGSHGQLESHLAECEACRSVARGLREVVNLTSKAKVFDPPQGYSSRLYTKVDQLIRKEAAEVPVEQVPIGITPDTVPIGSHLIHFWQTQRDFESGVSFLYPSLGTREHCIIFGHKEALDNVLEVLRGDGHDTDELIRNGKLTVLTRRADAKTTIAEIAFAIQTALSGGAPLVRFLGNLGLGSAPLPAGEDDVLDLEAKADALIAGLPAVIVCMYDVRTVPGRLLFGGGLLSHKYSICQDGVRKNPFFSKTPN